MGAIFVGNIVYKASRKRFENFKRWNTSVYDCIRHHGTNRASFIARDIFLTVIVQNTKFQRDSNIGVCMCELDCLIYRELRNR